MTYKDEYNRWLKNATKDSDVVNELKSMDDKAIEDAFYRDLSFGTGGLRGTIGAGTNRMNIYTVAKASQGLSDYLNEYFDNPSIVIGYDSRIKSDVFAKVAAEVFSANAIHVNIWPRLLPVPTVSFATRYLKASGGVMITASHNPSKYNGYKVYGNDGCQITTEAASLVLKDIEKLEIFNDIKRKDFEEGIKDGSITYIDEEVLTSFINEVKNQSVLYGEEVNKDVGIVYSPLNGTGLEPVTRTLKEMGYTNIQEVYLKKKYRQLCNIVNSKLNNNNICFSCYRCYLITVYNNNNSNNKVCTLKRRVNKLFVNSCIKSLFSRIDNANNNIWGVSDKSYIQNRQSKNYKKDTKKLINIFIKSETKSIVENIK